jgi:biotin carboxyl carrier protein
VRYFVTIAGESIEVLLGPSKEGSVTARVVGSGGPTEAPIELRPIDAAAGAAGRGAARAALFLGGRCRDVLFEEDARGAWVTVDGVRHPVAIEDERERAAHLAAASAPSGPVALRSLMPGIVRAVLVKPGQSVSPGQPLVILEAMKMENELRAEHEGVVREVKVCAGTPVEGGAPLVVLDSPSRARD